MAFIYSTYLNLGFSGAYTSIRFYSHNARINKLLQFQVLPVMYPDVKSNELTTVEKFQQLYKHLAPGEIYQGNVKVAGRIRNKREMGNKLIFYDIVNNASRLQVKSSLQQHTQQSFDVHQWIRKGDLVAVDGHPERTKNGELSIRSRSIQVLAPCKHDIPPELKDSDIKYRQRYLDMLVNSSTLSMLKLRFRIISQLRSFFIERGFIEVETPILTSLATGANARSFSTFSHALETELCLRVAPELYLKQLIIGGLDKVFEIGKQFRNEGTIGVDAWHNPEFTSCEFYQAYADRNSLMELTEELMHNIFFSCAYSKTVCRIATNGNSYVMMENNGEMHQIDFLPPYQIIDVNEQLQNVVGNELPDYISEEHIDLLLQLCQKFNISSSQPHTPSILFERLVSNLVEPKLIRPTFLINQPIFSSPLAKRHPDKPYAANRFELFVNGLEICNAYVELNDPDEQKERFNQQANDRIKGDKEAQQIDEMYCKALEYGLPPTAGWGIGVDRLIMLMAGGRNLRDVISFPILRPH